MKVLLGQDATITDPYQAIGSVWSEIKSYCQTKLSDDQCNALLGTQPIYFPPTCVEKEKVKWWMILLVGYFLGKHI